MFSALFIRVGRAVKALLIASLIVQLSGQKAQGEGDEIQIYEVNQKVADFPAQDDFSTPEAAYATIERLYATGQCNWRTVSVKKVAERIPAQQAVSPLMSAERAAESLNAQILKVQIFKGAYALVSAKMGRDIDLRHFELEDGRWLNTGNDMAKEEQGAADMFIYCAGMRVAKPPKRPPINDPQAALKPYQEYLKTAGKPPKEFVLEALAKHKLAAIGEIDHRPASWALNSEIVRDPRFAKAAGTIFLELPAHAQHLMDKFLAAKQLDTQPIIEMLRETSLTGCPDQPLLDFFIAVWKTNQTLDAAHRIRIVLVDVPQPWKELIEEDNLYKYDTDHDKFMADNILQDLQRSADKRHALFIAGFAHLQNVKFPGSDLPQKSSGCYLRQALPEQFYSIVQHGPILGRSMPNWGRTCLGLFDEAFAANGNQPIAFALANNPFGQQRFDLDATRCTATEDRFCDAFDAYIYLGPLEDEISSPLIPKFYTDEFVKELDQRYRLMYGYGMVEKLRLAASDAKSFNEWIGKSWGQPRDWKQFLGPVTAWHDGNDWKKITQQRQHRNAVEHPQAITAEVKKFFAALRRSIRKRRKRYRISIIALREMLRYGSSGS